MNNKNQVPEQLLLSEVQLLLAEKRTYFAILRTGLAVIAVPLTIIVFLLTTASYHRIFEYAWIGSSVVLILLAVSAGGVYLTYESSRKIKIIDLHVRKIEKMNERVDEIVV